MTLSRAFSSAHRKAALVAAFVCLDAATRRRCPLHNSQFTGRAQVANRLRLAHDESHLTIRIDSQTTSYYKSACQTRKMSIQAPSACRPISKRL